MRRFVILLFCCLLSIFSYAQQNGCQISVSGKIFDVKSKKAIAHATINMGNKTLTNSNHSGKFKLENLCAGDITLKFSHLSYHTKEVVLVLKNNTNIEVNLDPQEISLDSVQVSATSNHKDLRIANRLSHKQIQETRGKNLAESLQQLAGVNILRTGNNIAKPIVNGLYGTRLLLMNNGIRHESQQWGNDHAPEIDPFVSNAISIVKNADAVRYGPDALGGIILLEQNDIRLDRKIAGQINTIFNSNGKGAIVNTMVEGTLNKWGYRFGLTGQKSGNQKTANYFLGNTGKDELNGNLLLRYELNKGHAEFYASQFSSNIGIFEGAHIGSIDDILVRIAHGRPFEDYDFSYTIKAPKQHVTHQLAKLQYIHEIHAATLEATYSFQRNIRKEYDYRRALEDNVPMADMNLTTQQLELVYKAPEMSLGTTASLQVNNNITGTGTTPIIPNFDNYTFGAFANRKMKFGAHKAEIGLRYDYKYFDAAGYRYDYTTINTDGSITQFLMTDRKHFHNLSGVIGADFQINDKSTFKSNLGLAWRAPSANELYSDGIHHGTGTYEIGNKNLNSEKGLKWINSLGVKKDIWQLQVDIYGQLIQDYIYSQPNPDSVRQTIRGTFPIFEYKQHDALFYGSDINFGIRIFPALQYENSISIVRAKNITLQEFLPFIPSDKILQNVTYSFAKKDAIKGYIKLQHHFQAQQNRYLKNSDFQAPPPAYHLFNLIASIHTPLGKNKTLNTIVGFENMFNTEYKDYMDRFRYYTHSLGRNYSIKLQYTF